jgi:tetratricopeptide (TPR) repeat protein
LSVVATGGRVVVFEAGTSRDAISGQFLLGFDVRVEGSTIELTRTFSRAGKPDAPAPDCEEAFAAAMAMEDTDVEAAITGYRACIARHSHPGARANLGRLLHLQGRISEALQLYLAGDQSDATILYNQAVALEDLDRTAEAIAAYQKVVEADAGYADAHHNLARLLQQEGDDQAALRHWNAYRRLNPSSAE